MATGTASSPIHDPAEPARAAMDHRKQLLSAQAAETAGPPFPALEATLSEWGKELVQRVRQNLPAESVNWSQVHDLYLSERGNWRHLIAWAALDPSILFEDLSAATLPPLVSNGRPPYRRRHIHPSWLGVAEENPEVLLAPIAAGILATDAPMPRFDEVGITGRYGWMTPLEVLFYTGVGNKYLKAICTDRGVRFPRAYHTLRFGEFATKEEEKQMADQLQRDLDQDRREGIGPHLGHVLPGAPSPIAVLVDRLLDKPGGVVRSHTEAPFGALLLERLMDAGLDPREPIAAVGVGRVTPLEALFVERRGQRLALYWVKNHPELADRWPGFDQDAEALWAFWRDKGSSLDFWEALHAERQKRQRQPHPAQTEREGAATARRAAPAPAPEPQGRAAQQSAPLPEHATDLERAAVQLGASGPLRVQCAEQGIPFPRTYAALIDYDVVTVEEARFHPLRVIAALTQDHDRGADLALEKVIHGAPSLLALQIHRLCESGEVCMDDEIQDGWRELLDRLMEEGADPGERIWVKSLGRVTPLEALLKHPDHCAAPTLACHLIERRPDLMASVPDFSAVARDAVKRWRSWVDGAASLAAAARSISAAATDLDAVRVIFDQRSAPREPAPAGTPKPPSGARARVF